MHWPFPLSEWNIVTIVLQLTSSSFDDRGQALKTVIDDPTDTSSDPWAAVIAKQSEILSCPPVAPSEKGNMGVLKRSLEVVDILSASVRCFSPNHYMIMLPRVEPLSKRDAILFLVITAQLRWWIDRYNISEEQLLTLLCQSGQHYLKGSHHASMLKIAIHSIFGHLRAATANCERKSDISFPFKLKQWTVTHLAVRH